MTYEGLRDQVRRTVAALNARGIGQNDRVAIVLPNGAEMASAFLGVAAAATAAPLNPAYRSSEFQFYLSDLGAKALIVAHGMDSTAISAARLLGIPVLTLSWDMACAAGSFYFGGDSIGPAKRDGLADIDDVALVLHTSGTTSRPKKVLLSHRNLAASASHIVDTLGLSPSDRCLNIMPLFHIHGLVASTLSSLAAGGSVYCTAGLNATHFPRWLAEGVPTWYTAVPTMHQAILAYIEQHGEPMDSRLLRFIRSSSAALPPNIMRRLEDVFAVPVIESYGMTEAAHQMASNPLPPAMRKPGTVGIAAGPEITIVDSNLQPLPSGAIGEVVIRGANVISGYENNPEENTRAFVNGWFRTGDLGMFDDDGYLKITGRIKEIINRGGEKISPREIDDALLEHPAVANAAAFPIPHATLGEEVGVAVVLAAGAMISDGQLIAHLSVRLAEFKIPRRFHFVAELPKGPTGKVQRRGLADALGLTGSNATTHVLEERDQRPLTPLESQLKVLWARVLGLNRDINLHENFFLLGGDSLRGVQLLALIETDLGYSLPQSVLIESGTIAGMAARMDDSEPSACVVPFRTTGTRLPFFCIHDVSGQVLNLRNLAHHLGEDQPFYGIQCVGVDGKVAPLSRVEDMAHRYIQEMRKYQATGPYMLGGFSMGGWVAVEMTRQLRAVGESVAFLGLIDALVGHERRRATVRQWVARRWREFSRLPMEDMGKFVWRRLKSFPGAVFHGVQGTISNNMSHATARPRTGESNSPRVPSLEAQNLLAVRSYRMEPLHCNAVLFRTDLPGWDDPTVHDGWRDVILGKLEMRTIAGRHAEVVNEPFVRVLAAEISDCLAAAQPAT